MKSLLRRLVAPCVGLLLLSVSSIAPLAAQSQDSLRRVLETAKRKNMLIRVHTPSVVVEGRVPFVNEADIRVGDERVGYGSIAAVERQYREGGGARKGAIVGGITLGAIGGLLALTCDAGCAEAFPMGIVLGSGAGALLGAVTGRAGSSHWQRIWTAPGGVLASGDTLLVPLPEKPAPRPDPKDPASRSDNPLNAGLYVGGWFMEDGRLGGPHVPTTVGLVISRDYTNTELILLDLNLTTFDGDTGGLAGVKAGANRYILRSFYVGGAAGMYVGYGLAPLAEVAVGAADRTGSGMRLQFGLQAAGVDFCCAVGSVTMGFTLR